MNKAISKCKNSLEIFKAVNLFLNKNKIDDKYSRILQQRLKKEVDFNKSLQLVYDYILNSEHPMKKEQYCTVRFKGTAIGGMECHSPRL